jgi:hypothetical protein
MAQDIFLQSQNSISGRYAVLEDNGKVAFLYLTEPQIAKPARDAIVYSRIPPASSVDWEQIKRTREMPPLYKDIASADAVISSPEESEFAFKWSGDGHAVAILRNGIPLAFITMKERLGFSRAVIKPTPLANPWDQNLYSSLFGQ